MNKQIERLDPDDVISCPNLFDLALTFRVRELFDTLTKQFKIPGEQLFFKSEGMRCEVLQLSGGGWQKGKIRFVLELAPDQLPASDQPQLSLSSDDVISLDPDDVISLSIKLFGLSVTFRFKELLSGLRQQFKRPVEQALFNIQGGASCEVLQLNGGGWKKGLIRFILEFYPDQPLVLVQPEPEQLVEEAASPLDEIRRMTIADELSNLFQENSLKQSEKLGR